VTDEFLHCGDAGAPEDTLRLRVEVEGVESSPPPRSPHLLLQLDELVDHPVRDLAVIVVSLRSEDLPLVALQR
jgi:hypothetical protein